MPAIKTEYGNRKINDLQPYPENPRIHSESQIWQIARAIKAVGYITDIVIDESDMILSGHGRALAAQKIGIDEIPCKIIYGLSPAEKKAYVVADNKTALSSDWDDELLKANLTSILDSGEINFDDLGFTASELRDLDIDVDFGELEENNRKNEDDENYKNKEIDINDFQNFDHKCPKCDFEWNDK